MSSVNKTPLPVSLVKLMRPKQWVKQIFFFAALLFSGNLLNIDLLLLTILGCILFCLASSSVYVLNDICDREKDRAHPEKCKRPLASGAVPVPVAIALLFILLAISLGFGFYLNFWFGIVLAAYFVFNTLYSFLLKHIVILDCICLSISYVFRVVAGAVLIYCAPSPWIIICTFFLCLLIAIQKRRGEYRVMEEGKTEGRKVLRQYSGDVLRDMAVTMGAVTITAYCLYTFQSTTSQWMICTIPFVIFGLLRYQLLAGKTGLGETPEDILIHDKPMLVCMALWAVSCLIILYIL